MLTKQASKHAAPGRLTGVEVHRLQFMVSVIVGVVWVMVSMFPIIINDKYRK